MSELNLREVDKLEVTVLVDNYTDLTLLQSTEVIKLPPLCPWNAPLAEHGLPCFLRVYSGLDEHAVLMDMGVYIKDLCLFHNADSLEVDLSKVEAVVLGHGHFDHFRGLVGFQKRAKKAIPLILHPGAFLQRRFNVPAMGLQLDVPSLDETGLEETGMALYRVKEVSTLAAGLILVSGEVERVTDFEKGVHGAEAKMDDR